MITIYHITYLKIYNNTEREREGVGRERERKRERERDSKRKRRKRRERERGDITMNADPYCYNKF